MENQIWTLLARQFSGEATQEESGLLRKLMEEDPDLAEIINHLSADWYNPGSTDIQKALSSFSKLGTKIKQQAPDYFREDDTLGDLVREDHPIPEFTNSELNKGTRPFRLLKARGAALLKIAACLVLLCGAALFLFSRQEKKADLSELIGSREIKAPTRNIRQVTLTDGSVVWLNEESSLRLNDHFNVKQREVWLSGEAYFDVAKNKNVPFIIHAGKVNIRVLGTAFNVKSYPQSKSVETSLLRGSVEITLSGHPDAKYILKPNQKLVVPVDDEIEKPVAADTESEKPGISFLALSKVPDGATGEIIAEISWKERKLAFYETSFPDLAELLEKRYHVPIEFEDEDTKSLVFTGVFNKETLSQALHALSLSAAFRYRIEADKVFIFK